MLLYIAVAAVTITLSGFVDNHGTMFTTTYGEKQGTRRLYLNRACMGTIFIVLFLVSACRYKVGNDYKRYLEFFRLISKDQYVPTEAGFNAVVRFMQAIFGPEAYLSIFALFAFVTAALMLRAVYHLSEDFFFSFFLFMCFSYYFQSMNTIRYYLAIALTMTATKYVLKKEYAKFTLLILLASAMHKSVLIVIPIYLAAAFPWKKWFAALLTALIASGLVLHGFYMKVILFLYPTYENTELLDAGTSVVNIVRCAGVLLLTLIYYKQAVKDNRQIRFYVHLNYIAFLLYAFCSFLPEISRIGYYLTVGQIFLLPMTIARIENGKWRGFWRIAVMAAAVVYFGAFLYTAHGELVKLLPYQTWFFKPRFVFTEW